MPNGAITFGDGASGLDPIVPALSKNYTYSSVVGLVRLLSHTSGNTAVITNAELLSIVVDIAGQIARENWDKMQPFYLQSNTFNVMNTNNPYKVSYSTLNPYMDKFIGAVFLFGRVPVKMVDADALQRASTLTNTYANSVLGTQYDSHLELFVGSFITSPEDFTTEIYYYRQPQLSGITTSNYTSKYIDLPDSYIPELIDRAVSQIERTKQ